MRLPVVFLPPRFERLLSILEIYKLMLQQALTFSRLEWKASTRALSIGLPGLVRLSFT